MTSPDLRLDELFDREAIRDVVYRYCRGVDRWQLDIVRGCYHPDATDDHGDYRGGVDGFIDHLSVALGAWQHTTHFVGNVLIELAGDVARVETYAVAYHRRAPGSDRPAVDFVAGVRYVDDFARRSGDWRIARRVCLVDWTRTDPVGDRGWIRPGYFTQPHRNGDDPVFDPLPSSRP